MPIGILTQLYWRIGTSEKPLSFFGKNHQSMKSDFMSLQQWWDFGKVQIKQFCQQYTQNVTKTLMSSVEALESEVEELRDLAEATGDQRHTEKLEVKKSVSANLLGVSALVRSRFQNEAQMDVLERHTSSLVWSVRMDRKGSFTV